MKTFRCSFCANCDFTAAQRISEHERGTLAQCMFYSYCVSPLCTTSTYVVIPLPEVDRRPSPRAEVRRSVPWTRRPGASDNVGLEVRQKRTPASATVNRFTTRSKLLWKLNLGSQIDGVRGINCDCLRKLTCLTPFHSAACCHPA